MKPHPITIGNLDQATALLASGDASQFQAFISIGMNNKHENNTPEGLVEFEGGGHVQVRLNMNDTRPLGLDDMTEYLAWDGPAPRHVQQLLEFFPKIDGPVFVHCHAGWSRSPAVALLYLAWCLGPDREAEAVTALREVTPKIIPNEAVVALGDLAMKRRRRLFDAELMRSGMHKYPEIRAVYGLIKALHANPR